jgi:hypothetical protein
VSMGIYSKRQVGWARHAHLWSRCVLCKPLSAPLVRLVELLVGDLPTRVIRPLRLDEPRRLGRFGRLVDEALDVRRHLGWQHWRRWACPGLDRPDVYEGLGGLRHGRNLPPVPDGRQHREHDYDGHAHDSSRRAWDEARRAALGKPRTLRGCGARARELRQLALGALRSRARPLRRFNMGAIRADWPEDGNLLPVSAKSNFDTT